VARVSLPPVALRSSQAELRSQAAQLALAAAAIAVLFGAFLVAPFPVWAGQPSGPPTTGAAQEPVGWPGAVLALAFVLAMCLPFRPYQVALRFAGGGALSGRLVACLTALVAVPAALVYPSLGSDIFDYVGFERMWVVYGDNPLLALAVSHPRDWATAFVWYPDRTPAYGPLWAVLTWPIVRLAGDSPSAEVIGYKILSICAYVGCGWLIWTGVETARRQRALLTFAWSPLVLFEVLAKVHNDVLPALAMLALVVLLSRPRLRPVGLVATVAGALVKVTSLAAAPPAMVYIKRHAGWRALLVSVGLSTLLVLAFYLPFWEGPRTLASIWNQTSRVVWSPATLLIIATGWLPGGPYPAAVRVLLGVVWAGACAGLVLRHRLDRPTDLAATIGWFVVVSALLLTSAVYAHYLIPAVALAAMADDEPLRRLVVWLSIGGLSAYASQLLGLVWGAAWLDSDAYRLTGSLALLGPAALMLLLEWSRARGGHAANSR
jgi:hypothetical protein